jgi:hypothetical protein
MSWTPLALALAVVFGILAGWSAPTPNRELGFAGTPAWLRCFIITDLTVIISVWVGIINNLNLKAFRFQLLLPIDHSQLWHSRLIAGYIGLFAPLLTSTLMFSAFSGDYYSPGFQMWVRFVLVLLLLPALVHAAGTTLDRNYATIRTPLWFAAAAVVLACQWLVGWLLPPIWLTALLLAALSAALLRWANKRLPSSFQWRVEPSSAPSSTSSLTAKSVPGWLRLPIVSPWARFNCYVAADSWVRANMYVVVAGAVVMVWSASRHQHSYAVFELAFMQGFYLVFAIFALPRLAFLPVPKWRIFLQGAGQGFLLVLLSLSLVALAGRISLPQGGLLTSSAAAVTVLWFAVWFLATTAFIHIFLTYPPRRWMRRLSWFAKILHIIVACVPAFWAMPGDLPERFPDILELHHATAALLPDGALAWGVVIPIIALLYWLALRLFLRIEVTQLKDRLVKAK